MSLKKCVFVNKQNENIKKVLKSIRKAYKQPNTAFLHNFSLKLVIPICLGYFLLIFFFFFLTFKPAPRNYSNKTLPYLLNNTYVLKFLDQNKIFTHALKLQLCTSSFLDTDSVKHCFECLPSLGLKSSLFKEEFLCTGDQRQI